MREATLILAMLVIPLGGCSALHFSFVGTVSYNANAETKATAVHATSPVQPASAAK